MFHCRSTRGYRGLITGGLLEIPLTFSTGTGSNLVVVVLLPWLFVSCWIEWWPWLVVRPEPGGAPTPGGSELLAHTSPQAGKGNFRGLRISCCFVWEPVMWIVDLDSSESELFGKIPVPVNSSVPDLPLTLYGKTYYFRYRNLNRLRM